MDFFTDDLLRFTKPDRIACPACTAERRSKGKKDLTVTPTKDGVVYRCFHCERSGIVRYKNSTKREVPVAVDKVVNPTFAQEVVDYFRKRGISERVIKHFDLYTCDTYFGQAGGKLKSIGFPYFSSNKPGEKPYGSKIRAISEKYFVCDTPLSSLFGVQRVDLEEESHIVICEGEMDALSFEESGVMNAVSVPNGASSLAKLPEIGSQRDTMGFLWKHKEIIEKAARIYLAVDTDEPGQKLEEELARRIGKHKIWVIRYPEGCKDANEVLTRFGGETLLSSFMAAEPYPIAGLYSPEKFFGELDKLYEEGFGGKVSCGFKGVDELYSATPGLLTVVTGVPGSGKTTFINQIMINMARNDPSHIHGVCSFETPPYVHIAQLAEMVTEKTFLQESYGQRMTREELETAKEWISRHFKFFYQDSGVKASIASIMERLRVAIFRWGIKSVVIDPYNYIEKPKSLDNETAWIDEILTEFRLFAQANDLHIWFVAHPTKMVMQADGNYQVPKGYSIAGSAAWYSKADFGLTVYRDNAANRTRIVNWKTRFNWLGREGETELFYDLACRTFRDDILDSMPIMEGYSYGEEERRRDRFWDD